MDRTTGKHEAAADQRAKVRTRVPEQPEWLKSLLASIGDAVIAVDLAGCVTFLNRVAERLTGWDHDNAIGQPLEDVYSTIDETTRMRIEFPVDELVDHALASGVGGYSVLVGKDGGERSIEQSAAPIKDDHGQVLGIVLIFRDVTRERQANRALRESEARKSAILETVLDCIITIDHEGRIVEFNTAAEQTFGFRRADVLGKSMAELIVPRGLRHQHHRGLAHYLMTGDGPMVGKQIEISAVRADGTEFPVELAIARLSGDGTPVFTACLRDISERWKLDRRRNARLAVTQILAEANNLRIAIRPILQAVCASLEWDVGGFWTVDQKAHVLRCNDFWYSPSSSKREFAQICTDWTFAPGIGLPGRVWRSGQPAWIPDVAKDSNFPRAIYAAQCELHGAFGVPIHIGAQFLGVMEFFSRDIREPDADLLEMMATIGGQIGQFMQRTEIEEDLRRSEEELSDFFENAAVGLHWVDSDGTILRVNQAELDLLGYSIDEYVGHHIREFYADRALIDDIMRRLQAGETIRSLEARLRCKDGSLKIVQINANGLRDGDTFVHSRCFTHDITDWRLAQEQLRATEERFSGFMQNLPGLAWIKDLQGRYVYANETAIRTFNCAQYELFGKNDDDLFPPEAAAQFKANDQKAIESDGGVQVIEVLEHPDGTVHHSLVNKFAIPGADGNAGLVGGIAIDITARMRAEEQTRFQAQLLDAVDQAAIATDPEGTIIYWNRFAENLFGWAKHEALGKNIVELVVPPSALDQAIPVMEHLKRGEGWTGEILVQRRDATTFTAFVTDTPVFDSNGRLQAIIGISVDISERKQVESTLRFLAEASASLATLVDFESTLQKVAALAVPRFADWCAVDMAEPDGSLRRSAVAHLNPSKIQIAHEMERQYPAAPNAPSGPCRVLRTGESEFAEEIPDSMLSEFARDDEHLRMLRELGLRSYLCVGLNVRDKVIGVLTFVTAESGRRYTKADLVFAEELARRAAIAIENSQLYANLREADRLKDEFLAMLAHELRNPLAPIRNALQIMKMPGADATTLEQVRDMSERQVQLMARLLDDLLDVSRITRGTIELRKEVVDVASLVNRTLETIRPFFEERQHHLTISLPPESVRVEGDPTRLEQVLTNLLNNAAKYTDRGGQISLAVQREGPNVVMRVRDNGSGISPEMLTRIFDLFVQAERQQDRSQGGVGIGLTLVRRLVELHGGTVEACSAGLGKGSEFIVCLPAMRDYAAGQKQRAGDVAPANALPSRRVLVVDDNQDSADSLALLLKFSGQKVRTAYGGPDALKAIETERPDIVFLDIGMPGMDGYEVAREIRKLPEQQKILLVALTGWGQQEDRRRTQESGFDHHLVKPVEVSVLRSLLG